LSELPPLPIEPDSSTRLLLEVGRAVVAVLDALGPIVGRPYFKDDRSPVTSADLAIQAAVAGVFERLAPDATLVGEEGSDALERPGGASLLAAAAEALAALDPGIDVERAAALVARGAGVPGDVFWALDPVDGTRGLLAGRQYSTALAHIDHGRVTAALLICPRYPLVGDQGCLALARLGRGAMVRGLRTGAWRRLTVSARIDRRAMRLVRSADPSEVSLEHLRRLRRALGTEEPDAGLDGQVKYLAIAAGEADVMIRMPRRSGAPENVWDHAAGALLVTEAGGRVSDTQGAPLDFGAGRRLDRNPGVVATNGHLHEAALEALRKLRHANGHAAEGGG